MPPQTVGRKGWQVLTFKAENFLYFIRGIFDASHITNSGAHYALCSDTFWEQYYAPSVSVVHTLQSNFTIDSTFGALYATYNMMFYSYELISGCSLAFLTAGSTTKSVFGNFFANFDFRILLGNLIHNLATFMQDLDALVTFFRTEWFDPVQYRDKSFSAGNDVGSLMNFALILDMNEDVFVPGQDPFATLNNQ